MLTDIRLQNFRSYKDESFELGPAVNIIVGPNASGKTNLLEAILVLASGRSYRARDIDLVAKKAEWARIDAHTPSGNRSVKIMVTQTPSKSFVVDDKAQRRLTLNQTLPVVLFEPNNLLLLSGEPALRRDFLDNLLSQISPGFSETNARYLRALKQRNTLLKRALPASKDQFFAWDVRLSELGGVVASERVKLIGQITAELPAVYSKLAKQKTEVQLEYKTSLKLTDYSSSLLKKLESELRLDSLRGFTGHGPHRDDLVVSINGQPMSGIASRGEARTLLLALKVIELKQLEQFRNEPPVLLLDDVFSELDGKRRRAVTEYLKDHQTFITTTDADVVVKNFAKASNIIALN